MTLDDSRPIEPVLATIADLEGGWTKAVFSHPRRDNTSWDKLTAAPVHLAGGGGVKLVSTFRGAVATRTASADGWESELHDLLGFEPTHINVVSPKGDWHARLSKREHWLVSRGKPTGGPATAAVTHDRPAQHPLSREDPRVRALFIEIGLLSHNGQLRGDAAAKHRQVQHYLELLRPLGPLQRPAGSPVRIVDAGCGKAYLSLALYRYAEQIGLAPELVGVDRSADVLASVERSARRLGYARVRTAAASIEEFSAASSGACDLLVSLHACDTATDEAIAAGIRLGAEAIVVAPCCHHELVAQMEEQAQAGQGPPAWEAITGSGLLRHRLADVVTDGLRAAALEAFGYRADVLEFVSPEATARNLMIRAERRPEGSGLEQAKAAGRRRFDALAAEWRVDPAIRRLLEGRW